MNAISRLLRRLVAWFRDPGERYDEISPELHEERERRRGMRGDLS